jgi:hypothetical protein
MSPMTERLEFELGLMTERLKKVTIPYRSTVKRGYKVTTTMFRCRKNYSNRYSSVWGWVEESKRILDWVETQRGLGRDVVVVTHGMDHPTPDIVCSRIYEKV